jgi:hypothetical protein
LKTLSVRLARALPGEVSPMVLPALSWPNPANRVGLPSSRVPSPLMS